MSGQPDTKVEQGLDERSVPAREQGESCLRRLWNSPTWYRRAPPPESYPPISSIPKTSRERLALASPDSPSASTKTILYLAYGSNLCAETFLGRRGIRPVSQINVSAPAFDLSFDLPGIPYNEPCFANTRPRKIPGIPGQPPKFPPPPYSAAAAAPASKPTWSKGVYGVVYEVTPEDYANIIKTEGGGQGYHDVLTLCFELPPALHVPEKPPFPELPKPFLAHTLYAPSLPDLPGDDDPKNPPGEDDGDDDKDPRRQPWFRRLFLPRPPARPGLRAGLGAVPQADPRRRARARPARRLPGVPGTAGILHHDERAAADRPGAVHGRGAAVPAPDVRPRPPAGRRRGTHASLAWHSDDGMHEPALGRLRRVLQAVVWRR
ncbi:hypothetical protein CIB48_g9815 [Xylaria polymorpha]|nr:hypothetical protein CIB48_g9815 [Xylaria polymorpha]